jgi:glycine/D-amino acid oxidase-like deaminating enzyme
MRTRYGVSPWIDSFPTKRRPDFPRLRGEHTTAVVIVGGGLTGCATAYACAAAGMRPLLLEAGRLGLGSAGRSAGLLLPDPGVAFKDIVGAHGLRAARRIFEGYRKAASDGAATLRRLNVRCDLTACEDVLVAIRDGEKELRRERDARDAAGLDARWITTPSARALLAVDAVGAIKPGSGFALDPYRASLGLAAAARSRGGTVFERTAVKKVRVGRKQVDVIVDGGGVIHADTVIITTGVPTAEFKPLRRHFKRRETYLVVTEPLPASLRKQLGAEHVTFRDAASPRHRVLQTKDGRLLIAGADRDESPVRQRDGLRVQRTGQLMYELLMMYPAISGLQPAYGWEMVYGETADGLMYVGPHRNYPRHLFALGSSGDTLAGAFLAARVLARAARGTIDKADEVFGWTR